MHLVTRKKGTKEREEAIKLNIERKQERNEGIENRKKCKQQEGGERKNDTVDEFI